MKNAANKRVVGRAGQFVFGVIVPIPPHTRDISGNKKTEEK